MGFEQTVWDLLQRGMVILESLLSVMRLQLRWYHLWSAMMVTQAQVQEHMAHKHEQMSPKARGSSKLGPICVVTHWNTDND